MRMFKEDNLKNIILCNLLHISILLDGTSFSWRVLKADNFTNMIDLYLTYTNTSCILSITPPKFYVNKRK